MPIASIVWSMPIASSEFDGGIPLLGLKMNKIEIETNIGSCAINVSAEINEAEFQKAAKALMGFLIWHDVASATYGGGKKAQFKRDDSYSPELGAKACEHANKILGKFFSNIQCETQAFNKLSDKDKFVRDMIKLGMSSEAAIAGWETAQAKMNAKPEEKSAEEVIS